MKSNVKILVLLAFAGLSAALDPSKDVEGKDCLVVEPIRNYTFNMTSLRSDLAYFIKSSDQPETFVFNVCGAMTKKCNNQTAAACVTDAAKKEVVFGYKDKLIWNDGSIRFSYVGERCNDTANYTMNVMLHCDYSGNKNDFLGAFHESRQCEATVILRTPLACLPTPQNLIKPKCIVKSSDGKVFDFNSLKDTNHKTVGPNRTTFIIGICNPVLYGHEAACEAGTSVCLYDSHAKNASRQYKSLGSMTEDFQIQKETISLKMKSNEVCEGDRKFSSKIIFICDRLATVSFPTYHSMIDCTYIFSWPTILACPDRKPCQASNAETGVSFDFSSLAGIKYEAINLNNTEEKIIFSVCSNVGEPCLEQTGSCVVKTKNQQSTKAGIANDNLKLESKNPYLLYEDGAVCLRPGNKFTTRIDFICADNAFDEQPVAVEDGCAITIQFKTLLACGNIKNCIAKTSDDEEIDLSPLIDYDGNYVATVNETTLPKEKNPIQYLLNVCRPLNSKYSLNCRGAAGACRTVIEENGKHESEMSLGHPDFSMATMKVGDNNEVIMKYFDGGTCLTDHSENSTTRIRFFCDEKAGLGNPMLQSIEQCQYFFDFPTNILCNEQSVEFKNGSCSLVNEKLSVSIDLKLFGINHKVGNKKIDICSGTESKFYAIVYKESMVRIEFVQESGKDKIDVEVQLKCSAIEKTEYNDEDRVLVMHESPFICPLFNITPKQQAAPTTESPAVDDKTNDDTTSSGGMAFGYVFLVSIVILAFVAFYFVVRNPERREILRNIIKFRSGSSNVQYSRVRLNEESLLLDNNPAGLSDSDDDNILL